MGMRRSRKVSEFTTTKQIAAMDTGALSLFVGFLKQSIAHRQSEVAKDQRICRKAAAELKRRKRDANTGD